VPEDFDPARIMFMKMIMALSKQLRATLEIVRSSTGKTFVLRFRFRVV
jgi:hypothetical protein